MTADPTFAQQLRRWRSQAGYTQVQLATALGLQQQTVSDWERGKAMPSLGRTRRLEELLGLEADQLVHAMQVSAGAGPVLPPTPGIPAALSGKWERLNARDRRIVERMVDQLLSGDDDD